MTPDWYAILGVARSAGAEEIRGAYLEQARLHHPDAEGGTTDRMQQINDAWSVLGDEQRRAAYDAALPDVSLPADAEWTPATGDGGAVVVGVDDRSGAPVVGVARAVIALAPVCFVGGILVFGLGVVLQVAGIVQAGLMILLLSLIAFLMAPFLAMGASRQRSDAWSPDTVSAPSRDGTDQPFGPEEGHTMSKVALIAKITAAEGKRDELRDAFAGTGMKNAAGEPGTEVYALNEDANDPDVLWFYEVYTDGDALAAHGGSDAMKELGGEIRDLMAGRPELTFLNFVTAEGI